MINVYILGSSHVVHLCICYCMLIASKNMSKINSLKDQLSGEFDIKNSSIAKKILSTQRLKH
jgi:hypothetical protein